MNAERHARLRRLQGRRVHVALADGSVLDRVDLVLVRPGSLWLFSSGEDVFVSVDRVVDVWDAPPLRFAA